MIDAILVPQGAEYQAVCRGISNSPSKSTLILSIPLGFNQIAGEKVISRLKALNIQRVVMTGLCGSLSPEYCGGDIVIYQSCFDPQQQITLKTDLELITMLQQCLVTASLVTSLTSDRIISFASEKQRLHRTYQTDMVDMEGFNYLELLHQHHIAVAMFRVVSDDARSDLPDLTLAIGDDGQLKILPLTFAMLMQPLAAIRLIKGSLSGLNRLRTTVQQLFN